VTTASRSAGAVYKHSFHINFPRVGFINNHGALRTFGRHLSSLDALQAMSANFQPMALIDTSGYSRNQNLRIIKSWKHHPRPTKEMASPPGFFPSRLHTMESLLQMLVTNVFNVTHWTREAQEQDNDAVLNMHSLLHTAGLDGVGGTTGLVSHHIFLYPCTGQRVSGQRFTLKTECNQGIWHIKCSHDACKKSGATIIYVYICMCVCICTSMRLYTCVCVCVCIFVHRLWVLVSVLQRVDGVMHAHVFSCAYVCVYVCVWVYIYVHFFVVSVTCTLQVF